METVQIEKSTNDMKIAENTIYKHETASEPTLNRNEENKTRKIRVEQEPKKNIRMRIADLLQRAKSVIGEFPKTVLGWVRSTFCCLIIRREGENNILKTAKI